MLSDFPILKKKFEMFFSHESKAQNQQNSDEKSYDELIEFIVRLFTFFDVKRFSHTEKKN
jgi:hypothetical protein